MSKLIASAMVGRCRTRHRRICGDVGGNSGSGSGNSSLDRIECQQRILKCSQFPPVGRILPFRGHFVWRVLQCYLSCK